jgi:hypothetical protein
MYIISIINKINNFTKDKRVFMDDKNSRLVPDYLQTCIITFRTLILWKHIYIFIYFCIFSSEEW